MKKVTAFLMLMLLATTITVAQQKPVKFVIHTNYGDIKGYLFNDTPKHRDNFVKLVNEGWYDGSVFHRVINQFMIQGGQNAEGKMDPGYRVDAEILPNHHHKKGALAAARQGDMVNPEKKSSGSQFYIVQGKIFNDATLNSLEQKSGNKFSEAQRKSYTTVGGTPHLDGEYTVFGQVADGFDVIDKIAAVKTQRGDKPVEDIKMTIEILK